MLVGFVVGFFVKKLAKFLAFLAGGIFLLLLYAQAGNYVKINWTQVQNATEQHLQNLVATDFGSNGIIAMLGIPMAGGLAVGFTAGIMKG